SMANPPLIFPLQEGNSPRPYWSVMIPTYKPRADYLEQTLRSVLQQDPGPEQMQIEVVDDASPKVDVIALVQKIAGDRVTVFRSPVNKGLAGCWNTCIERSQGEWVHILHQDDLVFPRFYSVLGRLIYAQPTAGAAFCRYDFIDSKGARVLEQPALQTEAGAIDHPSETLAIKNQVQCSAIVVRRSAYERVGGYDGQFVFTLDWEMWIRIAAGFPVLYHPELLASFRIQADSETSRLARTGETVRDSMRMIESFPNYITPGRVEAVQSQARLWVCDLALQKAGAFFANDHAEWAMAQLHAGLCYDKRLSSWRIAFRCWRRSVRKSKKLIIPPLPLLPTSWFQPKH
ncbi:MAG: glycosyl transferase family 2, partial [Acidobacteria bacterium]